MVKNPWMSLWLSAANTWAGAARSFWVAEVRRQQQAVLKEATGSSTKRSRRKQSAPRASTRGRKK
jgi:hypothetical protein